ncbi:uncharacterized protein LOC134539398 [Bacillus rossius redtenbacheri]
MERARRELFPPITEDLREFCNILDGRTWADLYSPNHEKQLAHKVVETDNGQITAIVFANDTFLQFLSENPTERREVSFDATFKVVPRRPSGFCQLMTAVVYFQDIGFPIFFALMTKRTQEAYVAVLDIFHQKTSAWEIVAVSSDFEKGLVNAIITRYPNAEFHGCWYHCCQAIWRMVMKTGLVEDCKNNDDMKRAIKMLMALAHLPATRGAPHDDAVPAYDIADGLEAILIFIHEKNLEEKLANLIEYFQNYWMARVTPRCFSVFNLPRRTNNALESFHALVLSIMGPHANVWKFLVHLSDLSNMYFSEFKALVEGKTIRRQKPQNTNTQNLRKIIGKLVSREFSVTEFLRKAAHTVDGAYNTLQTQNARAEATEAYQASEDEDDPEDVIPRALRNVPAEVEELLPEDPEPDQRTHMTCKVCLLNPLTHLVYPCGHFVLCENCVIGLRENQSPFVTLKCPVCRSECGDIVRVFFA